MHRCSVIKSKESRGAHILYAPADALYVRRVRDLHGTTHCYVVSNKVQYVASDFDDDETTAEALLAVHIHRRCASKSMPLHVCTHEARVQAKKVRNGYNIATQIPLPPKSCAMFYFH